MEIFKKYTQNDNLFIVILFFIFGFTAVSAQVLFLRSFLASFSGNEISIGFFFAGWLLWTAMGGYFWGRKVQRGKNIWRLVLFLQTLAAFLIPLTMSAIKLYRLLFLNHPAETAGPGAALAASLVILMPFAFVSGGLFAAGSHLNHIAGKNKPADAAGWIYCIETGGSAAGGLVFGLLLLFLNASEITVFIIFFNAAAVLFSAYKYLEWNKVSIAVFVFFISLYSAAVLYLDNKVNRMLWPGYEMTASRDSHYGRLELIKQQENLTLLENGIPLFTVPDLQTAEETVHYGLLAHEHPQSVLLIGGGINGQLEEILSHPSVINLDYVEHDRILLEFVQKYIPDAWSEMVKEERVTIHNIDGRLFLKNSIRKYDVILLAMPDPFSAQINRFYTKEFFQLTRQRLNEGGVLAFQVSASENYINKHLASYLRCIRQTLLSVFKSVLMIPGESVYFTASNKNPEEMAGSEIIIERLKERRLNTEYVREYFIPFRMSAERMEYLQKTVESAGPVKINSDLAPNAYYLSSVFWSSRFSVFISDILESLQRINIYWFCLFTAFCFILMYILGLRKESADLKLKFYSELSIAASGFSMISLQLLILLLYQASFGALYFQLAVLVGIFMAGMSAGTFLGLRLKRKPEKTMLLGINLLLSLLAVTIFFLISIDFFGTAGIGETVFYITSAFAGWCGGFIFPVVSRVYYDSASSFNPGAVYALDLTGALAGSLLTVIFIIPLFGFAGILILISCLHLFLAAGIWGGHIFAKN